MVSELHSKEVFTSIFSQTGKNSGVQKRQFKKKASSLNAQQTINTGIHRFSRELGGEEEAKIMKSLRF